MAHYQHPDYDYPDYDYPDYDYANGHPDSGDYWYQDDDGYTNQMGEPGNGDAFEDVNPNGFVEEPPVSSGETSFFQNASNFVINGGSFGTVGGDSYTQFGWGSKPPRPPPNTSGADIFKGASHFVISDDHPDAPQEDSYTRSRQSNRNRGQQEYTNVSQDQDPSQDFGRRRSSKPKRRVRSHVPTFPGPDVPMPIPGPNVPVPIPVPSDTYTSDYSRVGTGAPFPTPDPHSSPVNITGPVYSLPVPPQTPTSPAFSVRHGYGKDHPIPQKRFRQTTESQQQSEYGNRKTKLDAELNSTTRKLKKLALGAKCSSESGTHMVGLDDQSPGISMPAPQGANLSTDWRSPSPSPVSRPEMSIKESRPLTETKVLRTARVRLGVPQPSPLDMPQPSTSQVTFPQPQQG